MAVPLNAYVVIDNNVLVMLTDIACTGQPGRQRGADCITAILDWITEQLRIIRGRTPDGSVHCSGRVIREYRPEKGILNARHDLKGLHFKELRLGVCSSLVETRVDPTDITFLKTLMPRQLKGKSSPKDNDLSLIALGLNLTGYDRNVYILSNDQALVDYVSKVCRNNPRVRERWANPRLLDGLHCMTYLQSVHAACLISNEQLLGMLRLAMREHVKRMADSMENAYGRSGRPGLSPHKAKGIYQTMDEVLDAYGHAVEKKAIAMATAGVS